MKINEFTDALTRKYQPQTLNESLNEEGSRRINEADLGDGERYDKPRIIQYSVDVYDSSFSGGGLSESDIIDALEGSGIQVLGCGYQCSWKNDRDYERNIQESLNEAGVELPIRKALQATDIMKTLDRDPNGSIKKAVEVVKNSPEVSDKDKRDFIKYMSSGSRDKKASTLASYFYDVNLAGI